MRTEPRILNLTIKREYFDLIKSGEKKVEYRKISQYYVSRFKNRTYDRVIFRNGYAADSPRICMEVIGIQKRVVVKRGRKYGWYEIHLGKKLKIAG